MATITIKIDSDELAREVLARLGYLPEDDISIESDEEVRPAPKTHVEAIHERMACVNELLPKSTLEAFIPEAVDGGFGTPIEQTDVDTEIQIESMYMDAKREKTQLDFRATAALMKERLTHLQYMQYLETCENDTNPDIIKITKELIQKEKAPVATAEEKLKHIADQLISGELKDYLDAACEDDDEDMRRAAKEYLQSNLYI